MLYFLLFYCRMCRCW